MPLKPIKRGYKVWCICDSINGLAYEIEVYLGATEEGSDGSLGERVVLCLVDKIKGESHHVYMDNFFTSPSLSLALRNCQTFLIGTVRGFLRAYGTQKRSLKQLDAVTISQS